MHVLVTGAAGFIGSHLCEQLLRAGHQVTGVDALHDFYAPSLKLQNLKEIEAIGGQKFRHLPLDLRDLPGLQQAMHGHGNSPVDAVAHLAALAGVQPSIRDPLAYEEVNVRGTLHVLESMRQAGVKRLVFASSSSVYGNGAQVPFAEDQMVDRPISPYAATKKSGELFGHTWHHLHDFSVICLRFFTVYGPRQRPDLAIAKFIRLIASDQPIQLYGDGSSSRDYTYVLDTVDGIVRALDATTDRRYLICNIGNSVPISLKELVAHVETAVGKKAKIQWLPMQSGDVDRTWADVRRAQAELGYASKIGIAEGIQRQADWFLGRQ